MSNRGNRCNNCGGNGHWARDCPNGRRPNWSNRPPTNSHQSQQRSGSTRDSKTVYDYASSTAAVPSNDEGAIAAVDEHAQELIRRDRVAAAKSLSSASEQDDISSEASAIDISRKKRDQGLRTSFGVAQRADGSPTHIATNYLALSHPSHIHAYKVEMVRAQDAQGSPILVRKKADKMLIMAALSTDAQLPQLQDNARPWVHDGDMIWSTVPLFANAPVGSVPWSSPNPPITYKNETNSSLTLHDVRITYERDIDLTQAIGKLFYDDTDVSFDESLPGILTRALNAFLSHNVTRPNSGITVLGGNRSFQSVPGTDLNRGNNSHIRALQGFFLSARPGVERLLVNINTTTSPFFRLMTVSSFIEAARTSRKSEAEIRAVLKGVKVEILYTPKCGFPSTARNQFRLITEILFRAPRQCVMHDTAYPEAEHLEKFYDRNSSPCLSSSDYPTQHINITNDKFCVNVGRNTNQRSNPSPSTDLEEWYPASQLRIVQWQPFRGTLNRLETTGMIGAALRSPQANAALILGRTSAEQGLSHYGFSTVPQTIATLFNTTVGTDLLKLEGRWLSVPTVHYGNSGGGGGGRGRGRGGGGRGFGGNRGGGLNASHSMTLQPDDAAWNLNNTRFVTPASIDRWLPILNLMTSGALPQEVGPNMIAALEVGGLVQDSNMQPFVETPPAMAAGADNELWLTNCFANLERQTGPNATRRTTLVVMQEKSFDEYAAIKRVADLQLGKLTICATRSMMNNRDGGFDFNKQKAANIALKYNFKGAGDNHHLADGDFGPLKSSATGAGVETIVLGADVAHPTNSAAPGCPSIAAVVGSTDDNFMQFPGSMRLQASRNEGIEELSDMVFERLVDWAQKRQGRPLPKNVLFYRDGVSESQYDIVRKNEIPQIAQAFHDAEKHLRPGAVGRPEFALTFVVVGKRHNTRFYPLKSADSFVKNTRTGEYNGNVKPGLVVDKTITHPYSMDFFLQSHNPIQGTGRSAHYYVLTNQMDLSSDELQKVTHSFCYVYARATRGVSYCAPAYYADRLCDRGRAYLRGWLVNRGGPYATRNRRRNEDEKTYHRSIRDAVFNDPLYRPYARHNPALQHHGPNRERRNPWHANLDGVMFYL